MTYVMQEVKDHFSRSQHASELGKRGAKGIRTPDLLHAMRAGFVRRCLARSRFGTSGQWSCLAESGCICCGLGALSFGSSLVTGILRAQRGPSGSSTPPERTRPERCCYSRLS
jgi:hypothetical protein